jgi:hypothetical protein
MTQPPDNYLGPKDVDPEAIDPDAIDTGEPIYLLANLEEPASTGFLERLGRRIERRRLGAEVTGFFWHGPLLVLVEFLKAIFESPNGQGKPPEG